MAHLPSTFDTNIDFSPVFIPRQRGPRDVAMARVQQGQRAGDRPRSGSRVRAITTRFPRVWLASLTATQIGVATVTADYDKGAGCFAADATIADKLGVARSTVNAAFSSLERAGVVNSAPSPVRATLTRRVQPLPDGAPAVTVSAYSRDRLAATGARFAVYCELAFRQDVRQAASVRDVAAVCGVSGEAVRLALRALETDGWITRTEEGGGRGKAARYAVHDFPLPRATQLILFPEPRRRAVAGTADTIVETPVEGEQIPGQLPLFSTEDEEENPQLGRQETPNRADIEPPNLPTQNRLSLTCPYEQAALVLSAVGAQAVTALDPTSITAAVQSPVGTAAGESALRADRTQTQPTPERERQRLTAVDPTVARLAETVLTTIPAPLRDRMSPGQRGVLRRHVIAEFDQHTRQPAAHAQVLAEAIAAAVEHVLPRGPLSSADAVAVPFTWLRGVIDHAAETVTATPFQGRRPVCVDCERPFGSQWDSEADTCDDCRLAPVRACAALVARWNGEGDAAATDESQPYAAGAAQARAALREALARPEGVAA
ncbi:hypothetical protein ACFW17_22000 [Streptomyces sp. NPDC058961]|uniref:hypothetical protein n=1 Tax=Streptomyces sp. NPDC058961 TaxID=3346680 RepID=UPI0036CB28F3